MTEKTFLSPEEVAKRRERKVREIKLDDTDIETSEIKQSYEMGEKYQIRGGKVRLAFETLGRFDIDPVMYFEDYKVDHVDALTMTNQNDLLETVVAILDEIKNSDSKGSIGDCLLEEFMEIMIGIKQEFNTPNHTHRWVCECQHGKPEKEMKVEEMIINLRELKYKTIEMADLELRDMFKNKFLNMTDVEFEGYLKLKYKDGYSGDLSHYNRETELNNLRIEEPIAQNIGGKMYRFNFTRVKDLIKAKKVVERKYSGKIKMVQSRQQHGIPGPELKAQKEEELKAIDKEKAKDILLYARAYSLVEYDGNNKLTDEEKIAIYRKIPRQSLFEFVDFLDRLKFGIQDEREFYCPECGKTQKRLLQRKFDSLEFLPIESVTNGRPKEFTGTNIFIGV